MIEKRRPKIFYGYIVVLASIIASIFLVGAFSSFGIFFKPMSAEFGWPRATTSVAASVAGLVMGFAGIAVGRITDRYGPRVIMVSCGLLMGIGHLLMSQVGALWNLYLFHGVLIGGGMSASEIPIVATVARWFVKRRGMFTGITKVGAGVGIMVIPLLSSWLITSYGWRNAYIVIGVLALVGIISMGLLFKRDPGQVGQLPYGASEAEAADSGTEPRHFSLREAMATRQFWQFALIWSSFLYCVQVVMVHIANHVTDLGISATMAASVFSVIGGFSILGRLGLAGISDVIGPRMAYLITFCFLATALFWLQFAREPWMFYLFAALYGTAHGASFSLLAPMNAEMFGLRSLGSILGIILFIGTASSIISPMLTGRIFDIMGSYQVAFWICFSLAVVGIIMILLLRPTGSRGGAYGP